MATWTLRGEDGAGLDDTVRTIQSLGIDSASLEFASLAEDVLTFSMKTTTAAGAGVDGVRRIPDAGQKIELFRNGTRKFVGHATMPEIDLDRVTVRVVGPWFWMSQIPISSSPGGTVDSSSDADGSRPVYAFPTQGLRESMRVLNNAARAAGVPVQNISTDEVADFMDSMFTALKTTISGRSWGDAAAEMLNWCLDAVAWFDHSTATPKFRISRRGAMTPLTLTVGNNITSCKIRPRVDLEVKRVELHYVTRHPTTGLPRWARQSFGSADVGKVQMVPISGPDVSDLVPKDDFDSAKMQTMGSYTPDSNYVAKRAGSISSLIASNGMFGGVGRYVSGYTGTQWASGYVKYIGYDFGPIRVLNPNGTNAATSGKYLLLSNDQPEWFSQAPIKAKKVKITGTWIGAWQWASGQPVPSAGFNAWWQSAPAKGQWWAYDFVMASTAPVQKKWFAIPFECDGVLVSVPHTSVATVYRPWEWDYLDVPDNLAENLRSCQNWTPWEGTIETIEDDVSGDNLLNRKIRLANSAPVCATMDALLKRVRYDLIRNRTVYTLGAPARIDFGSFIARLRSQKIDRIKYL